MQPAMRDVQLETSVNGEMETAVGVEARFETGVARLRMHLSGWGAPFADMGHAAVREIAAILVEYWRLREDANDTSDLPESLPYTPDVSPRTEEVKKTKGGCDLRVELEPIDPIALVSRDFFGSRCSPSSTSHTSC